MVTLDGVLNFLIPVMIICFFIYIIKPLREFVAYSLAWLGMKIPEWFQGSKEGAVKVVNTGRGVIVYE